MSAPFTTPDTLSQALFDELALAYSERRQAIGQSAYVPQANRNVQSSAWWRTLQEWIEDNCGSFVDHVNGPINEAGDDFRYWEFSDLLAAMGIAGAGFRRTTYWDGVHDPMWSYGAAQEDDVLGPWAIEDIQKALALLWKTVSTSFSAVGYKYIIGTGKDPSWSAAKASAESAYLSASPWFSDGFYCSAFSHGVLEYGSYYASIYNFQLMITLDGVPNFLPRAATLYAIVGAVGGGLFDANGLSDMAEDKLSRLGVAPATSDALIVSPYVGLPLDQIPNWTDGPLPHFRGFRPPVGFGGAIIDWSFTNA